MNILTKNEIVIIKKFLKIAIPQYICEYDNDLYDLADCYEIAFTFSNALLRGEKINPGMSPWGDGKSIIFEPAYTSLLLDIKNSNFNEETNYYCSVFLDLLSVFKSHFTET